MAAAIVVPVAQWGSQPPAHPPTCVLAMRDRETIISGASNGHIVIWRAASVEGVWEVSPRLLCVGHHSAVRALAEGVCDKGEGDVAVIISGSEDGTLCCWDARDGLCLQSTRALPGAPSSLATLSDGKHFVCAGQFSQVFLMDVDTLEVVRVIHSGARPNWVRAIALCALDDGSADALFSIAPDGTLKIWAVPRPRHAVISQGREDAPLAPLRMVCLEGAQPVALTCDPCGRSLLLVAFKSEWRDGCAYLFECPSLADVPPMEELFGSVGAKRHKPPAADSSSPAFLPSPPAGDTSSGAQGLQSAAAGMGSPTLLHVFRGGLPSAPCTAPYTAPNTAASVSGTDLHADDAGSTWCPSCPDELLRGTFPVMACVAASRGVDGETPVPIITSADSAGNLFIWAVSSSCMALIHHREVTPGPEPSRPSGAVAKHVCTSPLRVRSSFPQCVCSLQSVWPTVYTGAHGISACAILRDDSVACGLQNGDISVSSLHTFCGRLAHARTEFDAVLHGHRARVTCLMEAAPPIAGSRDGSFGASLSLSTLSSAVRRDRLLVSGSADFTVRVWSLANGGKELYVFGGHSAPIVTLLEPCPDSDANRHMWICSVGGDHSVALYSLSEGRCMYRLTGHPFPISTVRWRAGDDAVVVGCADGTAYVWQLATGHLDRIASGQYAADILESCDAMPVKKDRRVAELTCVYDGFLGDGALSAVVLTINVKRLINELRAALALDGAGGLEHGSAGTLAMFALSFINAGLYGHPALASCSKALDLQEPTGSDTSFGVMGVGNCMALVLPRPADRDTCGGGRDTLVSGNTSGAAACGMPLMRWRTSANVSAVNALATTALANAFMTVGKESLRDAWSKVVTFYCALLPDAVMQMRVPSVLFMARFWQDTQTEIQEAARALLLATLARMRPHERGAYAGSWFVRMIKAQTGEDALPVGLTGDTCVLILGILGSEYPESLAGDAPSTVARMLAMLVMDDSGDVGYKRTRYRMAAAELLGKGFQLWQPHIDVQQLLRRLMFLTGPTVKDSSARMSVAGDTQGFSSSANADVSQHKPFRASIGGTSTTSLVQTATSLAPAKAYESRPRTPAVAAPSSVGRSPISSRVATGGGRQIPSSPLAGGVPSSGGISVASVSISAPAPQPALMARVARHTLMLIASTDPNMFVTIIDREMAAATSNDDRASVLRVILGLVKKKPGAFATQGSRLVDVVMRCLDPNVPHLRDRCIADSSAILHEMVKNYPNVNFHNPSQRFAVGTPDGSVVVYDLKTGTRLHVFTAHSRAVTAVAFRHDGGLIASHSAEERLLRVWRISVGFFGMLGGAPKCVREEVTPTVLLADHVRVDWSDESSCVYLVSGSHGARLAAYMVDR